MKSTVFDRLSLDRRVSRWEEHLDTLTPVQTIGGLRFKREDYFAPLGYGGINGSKVRQCIWLFSEHVRSGGILGVLSASSLKSPQISAASVVGRHYGMDVVHVVGAANPRRAADYPDVAIGAALGVKFLTHKVSYNPYIQKKLGELSRGRYRDYFVLPYGIAAGDRDRDGLLAFHSVGAAQVANLPEDFTDLVIPAGSCNTTASILLGLARRAAEAKRGELEDVHLFGIGPPKLEWLEQRLLSFGAVGGRRVCSYFLRDYPDHREVESRFNGESRQEAPDYRLHYYDLHSTKVYGYDDLQPFSYEGLAFHPRYEGKVMAVLTGNPKYRGLMGRKTLFWVVGSSPRLEKMPMLMSGGWGYATFEGGE